MSNSYGSAVGFFLLDAEEQTQQAAKIAEAAQGLTAGQWVSLAIFAGSLVLLFMGRQLIIWKLKEEANGSADQADAVDAVAAFREAGVQLYAEQLPTVGHVPVWVAKYDAWNKNVANQLQQRFTFAFVEWFKDIGPVTPLSFKHAVNDEHRHHLSMLARDLEVLQAIMLKHAILLQPKRHKLGALPKQAARWYRGIDTGSFGY